ncbi:MAG: hypothetical protein NZ735_00790 [Candidatus Marinimicrobia bacterium]|nr:hypothetical protein [Candidatus Neomarinimicrobiota bacterium]
MKNLLYILLFVPLALFGQEQLDCSLLEVADVVIENTNMTIDIAIYDGGEGAAYPFIAYTIDNLGDTIQTGTINSFGNLGLDTSWYSYPLNSFPNYPLTVYYVYGMNSDTCILTYNSTLTSIIDVHINEKRNLLKIIDLLGRETYVRKNSPMFYIYDDGIVEKKIIIE